MVNKTITAGLQEQEQEEKLPQVSAIPCNVFRQDTITVTSYGAKTTSPQERQL